MKKRWFCLFVENEIGVLARISGLFSGKSYNLDSLTVGVTEDRTISRITISLTSDDRTFEQVKELMFVKISGCSEKDIEEIFRISQIFNATVIDYDRDAVLVESVKTENSNNDLIALLGKCFANRIEIVRGGSVAVEAINITDR